MQIPIFSCTAVAGCRENRVTSSYRNSFGHSIDAACGQLFAGYEEAREFMSQRWTKKLPSGNLTQLLKMAIFSGFTD